MAPEPHPSRRGWVIFVIAAVVAAAIGVGIAVHQANLASAPASVPEVVAPPTLPPPGAYAVRPGPGGTTVLTEGVDSLTLSVPNTWKAPPANPYSLPTVVDDLAAQAPALAAPLQAVGRVETKAGVRLFAYQPAAPHAFVSAVSFSSPGTQPYTAASVAAIVALSKKHPSGLAVSGQWLPVGEVLELRAASTVQKQGVVIEILVLIDAGRTIEVTMVSETDVAAFPPLFQQIAESLRLG